MSKVMQIFLTAFLLLSLNGNLVNGQTGGGCDGGELQKIARKHLDPYHIEALVTRHVEDLEANATVVEAAFFAYSEEEYQFCNLSSGFNGAMTYEIIDPEKKTIYNSKDNSVDKCKFSPRVDGNYLIRFYLTQPINQKGCIAFAIGYGL